MPENFETEKKNEDDRYNGKIGIEIKSSSKNKFRNSWQQNGPSHMQVQRKSK